MDKAINFAPRYKHEAQASGSNTDPSPSSVFPARTLRKPQARVNSFETRRLNLLLTIR